MKTTTSCKTNNLAEFIVISMTTNIKLTCIDWALSFITIEEIVRPESCIGE